MSGLRQLICFLDAQDFRNVGVESWVQTTHVIFLRAHDVRPQQPNADDCFIRKGPFVVHAMVGTSMNAMADRKRRLLCSLTIRSRSSLDSGHFEVPPLLPPLVTLYDP